MKPRAKPPGAYATDVYGVHPYMLLNFAGQLGDVFTLAHEAGHCLHTQYSNTQPYVNKDYPDFSSPKSPRPSTRTS